MKIPRGRVPSLARGFAKMSSRFWLLQLHIRRRLIWRGPRGLWGDRCRLDNRLHRLRMAHRCRNSVWVRGGCDGGGGRGSGCDCLVWLGSVDGILERGAATRRLLMIRLRESGPRKASWYVFTLLSRERVVCERMMRGWIGQIKKQLGRSQG